MSPSCCISFLGLHNKIPQSKLDALSKGDSLFCSSGGYKSKVNVSAELVPSERL